MNPGIYPASAIPMSKYIADDLCEVPSLSSGCAHRLITRSPLHAWTLHPRYGAGERDDSDAADIGSVAHDMLLGGEGRICVLDPNDYPAEKTGAIPVGFTNKAIRAARDTARSNGLTPILSNTYGAVINMVNAAKKFIAHSELAGVFDTGESEATMVWQEGDAWCRARPDWLTADRSIHLSFKTTQASANPEPFIRGIMASMGYDMQMAFYARGLGAILYDEYAEDKAAGLAMMGRPTETLHVMLVQESKPPYACSLISLSPAMWAVADAKVSRAIKLWQECMRCGKWPAYGPHIHYAEPTPWMLAEAEMYAQ